MVPKLHAKGKSFRGCANYLLHDKERACTTERVEWTETRNLATDDPEVAWRVMAATSMDQSRLKTQAGIKNTGRKSKDHVLHLTLSWHPDEAEDLSREEMLRAANGALRALDAGDRQVLFVSHNDEPQPHLHIMMNRVSPEDGRMLSSSKEKLALSRWAEAYEKDRGQIFCEERVLNNEARDRKEFTRGGKDKPRHIFELEAANDNPGDANKVRVEQRKKDAVLAQRRRELAVRHAQQWKEFQSAHKQRVSNIQGETARDLSRQVDAIRSGYRPAWTELHRKHQVALQTFEERETQLLGRVQNAVKLVDLRRIIGRGRNDSDDGKPQGIGEVFKTVSSSGARLQEVKRQQEAQRRALQIEQGAKEREAKAERRRVEVKLLVQNRQRCEAERMQLVLAQAMDRAKTRAEQQARSRQRREAWKNNRPIQAPAQERAAQPIPVQEQSPPVQVQEQRPPQQDERAQRIAAIKQRMKDQARERQGDRER